EYRDLLAGAHALLTASKVEGFGLPIVEAQRAGVPVVCSATDIFTEVAGPDALFFPAEDAEALARRVDQLADLSVVEWIIESGRRNAARSSWVHSARVLLVLAWYLWAQGRGPRVTGSGGCPGIEDSAAAGDRRRCSVGPLPAVQDRRERRQ